MNSGPQVCFVPPPGYLPDAMFNSSRPIALTRLGIRSAALAFFMGALAAGVATPVLMPQAFAGAPASPYTYKDTRDLVSMVEDAAALLEAKGEDAFRSLITTDEGAARLGEVALVPHSSPISKSGIIFNNTLFDENAASHIAVGQSYTENIRDGSKRSKEELSALGANASLVHVDWMIGSGEVDIDLGESTGPGDAGIDSGSGIAEVDLEIDPLLADGAPPTHGPQLIHHLQTGIAYRMHLEGRWQRVRLNWISPGRAFFVFTHGKAHEKTISMTSRMLTKLCDTERFRAYEQAELIERATSRARKQLAKLTAASRQAALASR